MSEDEIEFYAESLNKKWHFGRYFARQILAELELAKAEYRAAVRKADLDWLAERVAEINSQIKGA